jgi:hypothetical protein
MKITTDLLKSHKACQSQMKVFAKTFPDGATVTRANLAKARKAGLSVEWLSELLPAPARAEYRKALAAAEAEYHKALDSAQAEYDQATAPARAEYDKALAAAEAEYDKALAPARAEYDKAIDRALVAAFRGLK